ncbi:MAG: DUF3127 domain-containing protein [Granulosicoccaceae bacterium]
MAYKAEGKLHKIFPTEQKTEKFSAREFVIELVDGKFPEFIKFQLTQDKCALMDDYSEGDEIVVDFDLRGREWNERYFTNLNAWRVAKADGSSGSGSSGGGQKEMPAATATDTADFDDDIPF